MEIRERKMEEGKGGTAIISSENPAVRQCAAEPQA